MEKHMDCHDCELEQIGEDIYCYYYGSKSNYSAWVMIKRIETGEWRYIRQNNISSSGEFLTLQECVDAAYADIVRSKI